MARNTDESRSDLYEALHNWLTPDWEQGNDHPEWCLEVVETEWWCSCGSDLLQAHQLRKVSEG